MTTTSAPRRILLSGAGGLIGRHLGVALAKGGAVVVPARRRYPKSDRVEWYAEGDGDNGLSGFDAAIHLAGEPVGTGRWTPEKKQKIYNSRVQGTQALAEALAKAEQPPRVFLCASGINIYGDCGDAVVDESRPRGTGFLADVCEGWEAATHPLLAHARVVSMRIGVVLTKEGGALAAMLPPFRLGLGGSLLGVHPYLSWISLADVVRAVEFLLTAESLRGPVNVVAPGPVTNREFATDLAQVLHRPAVLRMPPWPLRLALGQFAEETVLSSVRAVPQRLLHAGFHFEDGTLRPALARLLAN